MKKLTANQVLTSGDRARFDLKAVEVKTETVEVEKDGAKKTETKEVETPIPNGRVIVESLEPVTIITNLGTSTGLLAEAEIERGYANVEVVTDKEEVSILFRLKDDKLVTSGDAIKVVGHEVKTKADEEHAEEEKNQKKRSKWATKAASLLIVIFGLGMIAAALGLDLPLWISIKAGDYPPIIVWGAAAFTAICWASGYKAWRLVGALAIILVLLLQYGRWPGDMAGRIVAANSADAMVRQHAEGVRGRFKETLTTSTNPDGTVDLEKWRREGRDEVRTLKSAGLYAQEMKAGVDSGFVPTWATCFNSGQKTWVPVQQYITGPAKYRTSGQIGEGRAAVGPTGVPMPLSMRTETTVMSELRQQRDPSDKTVDNYRALLLQTETDHLPFIPQDGQLVCEPKGQGKILFNERVRVRPDPKVQPPGSPTVEANVTYTPPGGFCFWLEESDEAEDECAAKNQNSTPVDPNVRPASTKTGGN